MRDLWDKKAVQDLGDDLLALRVYSSRLIGQAPDLVLHGGGNTSVKGSITDFMGETHDVLYVKGSGWDLATIEPAGFPAVKMKALLALSQFETLSDAQMVKAQRAAMIDPSAPAPSVEAILHALIPFRFVDHTHADAVVALSNTPGGEERIRNLYGDKVLVVPYVMPGFLLAKTVAQMTKGIDWSQLEGMVLMHHGIFSFADDAYESYRRMIDLVSAAEGAFGDEPHAQDVASMPISALELATIRSAVSGIAKRPMLASFDDSSAAGSFASQKDAADIVTRGPLTPDHVIRTKRIPAVIEDDVIVSVEKFAEEYKAYFDRHSDGSQTRLDCAPRWALIPGQGVAAFGRQPKELKIIHDITRHTMGAIRRAERIGGWRALPERDVFEVEYWELEQAKLGKGGSDLEFEGRCVMITGGASGIGHACAHRFAERGAQVTVLDKEDVVLGAFDSPSITGMVCDVTDVSAVDDAVESAARRYGGIDVVVSNAGIFSPSSLIEEMPEADWQRSIDINLSGAMHVVRASIPFLRLGWEPSLVFIGSKNVPAPGPAAGAYSVAKAGLMQLARVLALEVANDGIRVNTVHPNGVFDTAIWTDEVLQARASHYGITVEEYRKNNLLQREVNSMDVAEMVCAMAGSAFRCTTGAQVPIDGGNDRVL